MRTKRLTVVIGDNWAEVSGWQARELLVELGGRPVWSRRRRAWATTSSLGRDVVCLAEDHGYVVSVSEEVSG